jgi:hypothetical protein
MVEGGTLLTEAGGFMEDGQGAGSDLVYHYTTAEGLKGIIENRCIWATNVNFLNDASEYHHGVEIVREEIKEYQVKPETLLAEEIEPTALARWLAKSIIAGNIEQGLKTTDYSIWTFVASFFDSSAPPTEDTANDAGDILEQWRAYGRDSVGFSIGFDKSALEQHVSEYGYDVTGLWTVGDNCSYEPEHKKAKVKRIIESLEPLLPVFLRGELKEIMEATALEISSGAVPPTQSEHFREFVEAAFKRFQAAANYDAAANKVKEVFPYFIGELMVQPALMKDRSFLGEKEWRLVAFTFDPAKVLLRSPKSGLIPYLEIPFSDPKDHSRFRTGLIKRVVVGPLGFASERESENANSAVRMLLRRHKIPVRDTRSPEGVIVESSRIPFRRW